MSARPDERVAARIALLPPTAQIDAETLLSRDGPADSAAQGKVSANRRCRLLRCAAGWAALNLARDEDVALIPALTGGGEDWSAIRAYGRTVDAEAFVTAACDLHLPASRLGEAPVADLVPPRAASPPVSGLRVVDCSALWAGPLCSGLLRSAGAHVVRIESCGRPDPTPLSSPRLDARLNGRKRRLALDLRGREGREQLLAEILAADVLVTSARPRALKALGLEPVALLAARPNLVWAAFTAHGWAADRVGFGDDCAVAGGLVRHTRNGPHFLADALADPLTGLEGALSILSCIGEVHGGLLDISMSSIAAAYTGLA